MRISVSTATQQASNPTPVSSRAAEDEALLGLEEYITADRLVHSPTPSPHTRGSGTHATLEKHA